jgi:transposase-like protein
MKRRNRYSKEFQEQALLKARGRGDRSLQAVAEELNMSDGTLSKWLSDSARKVGAPASEGLPSDGSAASWSAEQRLLALNEAHGLSGMDLHAWCRERGLFEHQLQAWRVAFCAAAAPEARESKAALRELQIKHDKLRCELNRKEKALAEAAALLVLQKKYQALWEGEEK